MGWVFPLIARRDEDAQVPVGINRDRCSGRWSVLGQFFARFAWVLCNTNLYAFVYRKFGPIINGVSVTNVIETILDMSFARIEPLMTWQPIRLVTNDDLLVKESLIRIMMCVGM